MDPGHGAIKSGEPPQTAPPARGELALAWPIAVQIAVVLLITASASFVLGRWSLGWSSPQEVIDLGAPALNLNRATRAELRLVPGLGDALSIRVVEYRQRHGPFRSVDDLRQVYGIGPKTLERIRPHLFVIAEESPVSLDDEESDAPALKTPSMPRVVGPSKKELALAEAINVNRADQATLQKLPGIGPKISQRILDERARANFKSVDDLRRVPGIGPKTLEKLRPHVTTQ